MWLKIYVTFAWALDTLYQILLLAPIYVYLVKDIGNPFALEEILS